MEANEIFMDLLEWITTNRPGTLTEHSDRIEIAHECGEHSTLWLSQSQQYPIALREVKVFDSYDGADLFSSTFKIASIKEPKFRGGVQLTFTLNDIADELSAANASLPEAATPFMIQQGIGIYSVGHTSRVVYEWDTELGELTEEFPSVVAVLDQWLQAIEM